MVLQKAVKSYPLVKWFLVASGVLVVAGLFVSKLVTAPDDADVMVFLYFVAGAVVLPFVALLFPRRAVVQMELPTDHLGNMSKQELEGVLSQLDEAKAKGAMDDTRYAKARERVLAAIQAKKKA